jgi:cytosine/adenosine deaminase-related metal-dependent hydrolase
MLNTVKQLIKIIYCKNQKMRRFSADYVYTLEGEPIANGIVVTDDEGTILAVTDNKALLDPNIERYKGVIVPGFINTHCHLELSHLKNKIEKGTGLISFVKQVIKSRPANDELVLEAIKNADEEMFKNGIVAVGDISNQAISADFKSKSKIRYHTFIEMLGFDATKASQVMDGAIQLKEKFSTPNSITVHAPYSLSKELLKQLRKYCKNIENTISIHNQETDDENFYYRYKAGAFTQFFKDLNIDTSSFKAQSKNTIQAIIPFLPQSQKILMVHNTYTHIKDIYFSKRFILNIYWCFCPNANLFIENKLPSINFFQQSHSPITLGTDSLASNDSLCILSEMKIIQKHFQTISFDELLKWATINGAEFLGFEDDLGSISIGKTPGLNLITNLKNRKLTEKSTISRLI